MRHFRQNETRLGHESWDKGNVVQSPCCRACWTGDMYHYAAEGFNRMLSCSCDQLAFLWGLSNLEQAFLVVSNADILILNQESSGS